MIADPCQRLRTLFLVFATVLAAAYALALQAPSPSDAHGTANIPKTWQGNLEVNWAFTPSGYGDLAWRNRVNGGVLAWNNLNQPMTFVNKTPSGAVKYSANFDPSVCPPIARRNGIHKRAIDGQWGVLGRATTCTISGSNELYSANVVFDSNESWYTGTGTPPSTKADLWAVAVHELGHAAGVQHITGSTLCATSAVSYHTMCPLLIRATTKGRSLETHDRHTFEGAY